MQIQARRLPRCDSKANSATFFFTLGFTKSFMLGVVCIGVSACCLPECLRLFLCSVFECIFSLTDVFAITFFK